MPSSLTWDSPTWTTRSAGNHSKSIGVHLHLAMIAPGLGVEPEKLFS